MLLQIFCFARFVLYYLNLCTFLNLLTLPKYPKSVEITQQGIIKSMIESQRRKEICDEERLEKFQRLNIKIVKNLDSHYDTIWYYMV